MPSSLNYSRLTVCRARFSPGRTLRPTVVVAEKEQHPNMLSTEALTWQTQVHDCDYSGTRGGVVVKRSFIAAGEPPRP